ncbi:hypothetical protein KPH14_004738 [Odynerus spinipes]|uniref:Phospholipase B1, membrane-associated n=1 Tax=Odynerus spinipes TaxID=1348599 RepID=A0AAD9RNG7_9HYME|nr:hypothetical protein KPH14_004738 [Odynerus spinipes]
MNQRFRFSFSYFWFFLLASLHTWTLVISQRTALDSPENLQLFRLLRVGAYNVLGRTGSEGRSLDTARSLNIVQAPIPKDVPFPCEVRGWRSSITPTSVHRLKPGDIDIIASLGDSLSAGTGIFGSNIFHLLIDNRGAAAAGGGQGTWREYLTLPNMLKEYNPNLYGYAAADFSTLEEGSKFNIAEAAAESKDMPYMALTLVKRLKNDPKVDMKKHWKHISLMIGSNDFCSELCYASSPSKLFKDHERDIVEALRIIRDNVPRAFVSLIPPPSLNALVATREGRPSIYCDVITDLECPCMFGLRYRKKRPEYYALMKRWQYLDIEISKYPEFQRDDFAVVAQPVLVNASIPVFKDGYTDMTYLAADCFHLTQKMNAVYANTLWNSLFLPLSKKPINMVLNFENIQVTFDTRTSAITFCHFNGSQ